MNRSVWMGMAAAALAAGVLVLRLPGEPPQAADAKSTITPPSAPAFGSPAVKSVAALPAVELSQDDREFLAGLRAKFARAIGSNLHARIKAIEQVIAYLREHYPDDWRGRVREFLAQLFPELADELYAAFERLAGFNEWLREHRHELTQLPPGERRAALWAARRAAFGDAAEQIWQGEIRNEKLIGSLATIDRLQGQNAEEKFARFLDDIRQAYGDDAAQFIDSTQTELINRFLSVPSVQIELRALPRPQQHAVLRQVRTAAGLDEAALERWADLDQARDQAWDRDQSYQLQREALAARFSGDELLQRLTTIQNDVFGGEADAIRSEEATGFFRYASARRLGRE